MAGLRRNPLPRTGRDDAAVHELDRRARVERTAVGRESQVARTSDGEEEVIIAAGATKVFFHTLGRPARWRFLRLATDGLAAGVVVEVLAQATKESFMLINLSGVDMTVVVEAL